tara:strand:- start:5922 stop:6920 length:999 start_codon:yes stop_codon:yes gene_type:complete
MIENISVLGGGSWGTALALLINRNGFNTQLYLRDKKNYLSVKKNRVNTKYFPETKIPNKLKVSNNLEETFQNADLLVIAIPSANIRSFAKKISSLVNGKKILIASKGVERSTFMTMSEVLIEELNLKKRNIACISGPNIAHEIIKKQFSAAVVSGTNKMLITEISKIFNNNFFKVFITKDIKGVELAAALKNVYAICAGLSDGLGYKSNTKAMLLTRAIVEMTNLFRVMNANPNTLLGLSGVGDLIATSSSEKSRNYNFGKYIGKGKTVKQSLKKVNQVVEGYSTLEILYKKKNELNIDMPIVNAMHNIIYLNKKPKECFLEFLTESGNIDS